MRRITVRTASAVAVLGLVLTPVGDATATPPTAAGDVAQAAVATGATTAPRVAPPLLAPGRLHRHGVGFAVDIGARVAIDTPSVVTLQLSVAAPDGGRLLLGPVRAASPTAAGAVAVTMTSTPAQTRALAAIAAADGAAAAAGALRIGIRQESDTLPAPGRESIAIASGGARWRGPVPEPPRRVRTDTGDITLTNGTPNPVVVMSGAVSCVYDSNFLATYSTNHASFIGQLNGVMLLPGRTITSAIERDASDLDSRQTDYVSNIVIQNWTNAVVNMFGWLSHAGYQPTLPPLDLPDSQFSADQAAIVTQMLSASFKDVADAEGIVNNVYNDVSTFAGLTFDVLRAFEVFGTDIPGLDQVLAIVGDIIAGVENICSSTHEGLFMVGASDFYQPWRQFYGVYNWNEGDIQLPRGTKNSPYYPYANGMLPNSSGQQDQDYSSVSADDLDTVYLPTSDGDGHPHWTFTEPPSQYQSSFPAVVTVNGPTRGVTCATPAADQAAQAAALAAVTAPGTTDFLTVYPNEVWQPIAATSPNQVATVAPATPPAPANYAVGVGYLPPLAFGTVAIYLSPDGQTWDSPVNLPPGQNSYTIPRGTTAVLVQCTTQAVETFDAVTTVNGRRLLMGTRLISGVVAGPDY